MTLLNEWVQKAEADFAGAIGLNRRRKVPLPDLVCYHCQQSAEKYLKAYLVAHSQTVPRIHDLEELLHRCEVLDATFSQWIPVILVLNHYGIETRYPGFDASLDEANEAIKNARRLRTGLRKKLGL